MTEITKVGVVGAGTMGAAIAQHFAMKGLTVCLIDQGAEALERGIAGVEASLGEAVQRRILDSEEAATVVARINPATEAKAMAECQLIVEAIFENLEAKQALFRELEDVVSEQCILASNTSSFQISDIARGLRHPERVVGVHYFYHAAKNKLVEVIPGSQTDPALVDQVVDFYAYRDKTPIRVADAPGFAVNRFFVPWLNEAVRLLEEGRGTITGIDRIARALFSVGMGPFALMNATGVPIARHAADGLAEKLGPFYAPAQRLIEQVDSGADWPLDGEEGENDRDLIGDRLLAASLGIAAAMASEGVATATDTDLGVRAGLRWPKGPFEMINEMGVARFREKITPLFAAWKMSLPDLAVTDSDRVTLDWVLDHSTGTSGYIEFNLPDRMNALGPEVMRQFSAAFDALDQEAGIETIFLCGRGKAFVAGADIKFFVDALGDDDFQRIYDFTAFGQQVLSRVAASTKRTVAYLDGLTLGGGLELALACDYRLGTERTQLAFPETGIGIYPGLGGTQRTPRLIGKGLAKQLIASGQFLNAAQALDYGLVDRIVERVTRIELLADCDPTRESPAKPPPAEAFTDYDGVAFDGDPKVAKRLSHKAPVAMKMAMKLIDDGAQLPLQQAMALELERLDVIFATSDALTGLTSILDRSRPTYEGR